MSHDPLTPELILETAEEVLRRFGPSKATVVDVARALKVSHGSVYRHFASKAALREAVVQRFLDRNLPALDAVAREPGPAVPRLRRWVEAVIAFKHQRACDDPELFATYMELARDAGELVQAHRAHLVAQAAVILDQGIEEGALASPDPSRSARALLDAMARFYSPAHVREWSQDGWKDDFEAVWDLILNGLLK